MHNALSIHKKNNIIIDINKCLYMTINIIDSIYK